MKKIPHPLEINFDALLQQEQYRKAFFELGIFEKNLKDGTGFIKTLWEKWGFEDHELVDGAWMKLIHPEDLVDVLQAIEAVNEGQTDSYCQEYRIRTRDYSYRWVLNQGVVISRDSLGQPEVFMGMDIDISSLRKTQESLFKAKMEAEQRVRESETLRMAGTVIASSLDTGEAIELFLQQTLLLLPYQVAAIYLAEDRVLELIGIRSDSRSIPEPGLRYPLEQAPLHASVLEESAALLFNSQSLQAPELEEDGEYSWLGVPLRPGRETIGLICFLTSDGNFNQKHLELAVSLADLFAVAFSNARQHQGTLELATIDPLTKTYTRRWFFNQAEMMFKKSIQKDEDISVLMVDIDHFKRVNDTWGHTIGDMILSRVSQACMLALRGSDIIGRYGGEEFSILLPGSGDKEAILVAQRLKRSVEHLKHLEMDTGVTVSIGICTRSTQDSLAEMIKAADDALYRAKQSGRNRVCSESGILSEWAEAHADSPIKE